VLDIVVTAAILLLGVLAVASRGRPRVDGGGSESTPWTEWQEDEPDLPCPWCLAPTREQDRRCPSCGQRFG